MSSSFFPPFFLSLSALPPTPPLSVPYCFTIAFTAFRFLTLSHPSFLSFQPSLTLFAFLLLSLSLSFSLSFSSLSLFVFLSFRHPLTLFYAFFSFPLSLSVSFFPLSITTSSFIPSHPLTAVTFSSQASPPTLTLSTSLPPPPSISISLARSLSLSLSLSSSNTHSYTHPLSLSLSVFFSSIPTEALKPNHIPLLIPTLLKNINALCHKFLNDGRSLPLRFIK
ncbi:Hypothetical predicted protein [Octopus vulgaris]|uniref:Uncharacterized protein n=1 Tax=Octopus vulgaris TaxID=6645 RepID=A0AA36BHX8_OCTVU|nr:Hypothetical predicted protein [Octopus vulgaris]